MRSLSLIVITLAMFAACGSDDNATDGTLNPTDMATVTGTVTEPPGGPPVGGFPAGSELTVQLNDVSKADAPSATIAGSTVMMDGEQFPIPFELDYDPAEVDERNTYTVSARIEFEGDLLAISDTSNPVITRGAGTTGIEVGLVMVTAG